MSDPLPTSEPTDFTGNPQRTRRPIWMRLTGLRKRPGKLVRFVPTKWGWTLFLLTVTGGTFWFMEYSMEPDFCRSCHLMEPYYQAWHESTHQDVACIECHFEPGLVNTVKGKWEASSQLAKTLTGTYGSKPHAEVRDASCLRSGCHERRTLEGKVEWTVQSTAGYPVTIHFDHTPHLTELRRGKQLRCVSCHSQVVQGQHIVVTLDTCYLCHFKGFEHGRHDETLGGCQACHESPKETIRLATGEFTHQTYVQRGVACENCHSDVVAGAGEVARQVCWTCHNQPDDIARYDDTTFLHNEHVSEHKVECTNCHARILHGLHAATPAEAPPMMRVNTAHALNNPGSCAQCHGDLHNGALLVYSGTGGRGVEDMPAPMFRAQVDCMACHRDVNQTGLAAQFAGKSYRTTQRACDHCHLNEYTGRLDEWKQAIELKLAEAEQAIAEAEAALAAAELPAARRLALQQALDDAHHNHKLVKHGKGVHNVTYATALLNMAIQNAQRVVKELGPTRRAASLQ